MDGFVYFAELPSSPLPQSRTCLRAWTTGRSVRCLKARRRSTWRSSSCTGSSPWSWTSSGATWPSSRRRSPRRARRSSRDRWETAAGGWMQDPGRGFSQSHLLPSFHPPLAGRSRSAAVELSLVIPAGSPQRPERAEVRDNGRLVVDYLLVSPEKLAFVLTFFFFCDKTLRWISWEKQVKSLPLNPANNI